MNYKLNSYKSMAHILPIHPYSESLTVPLSIHSMMANSLQLVPKYIS